MTRVYLTGSVLITVACSLELISPFTLYFNVQLIFVKWQACRSLADASRVLLCRTHCAVKPYALIYIGSYLDHLHTAGKFLPRSSGGYSRISFSSAPSPWTSCSICSSLHDIAGQNISGHRLWHQSGLHGTRRATSKRHAFLTALSQVCAMPLSTRLLYLFRLLEEGSFRGRTADFLMMLLFGGLCMCVVNTAMSIATVRVVGLLYYAIGQCSCLLGMIG